MKSRYICLVVMMCFLGGCATESGENTVELKRCDDMSEYYYCTYDKLCCYGECRSIDEDNCGVCDRVCGENEVCSVQNDGSWNCNCSATNKICTKTCCADGCVELENNSKHCGACGNTCANGAVCLGSICKCVGNMSYCDDTCVDVSSSLENCGICGNACPDANNPDMHLSASYCSGGRCYTICQQGYTNRDSDISNGCEHSSIFCGNGVIDPGESCDGYALNMQTCQTVLGNGYSGVVHCQDGCMGFDTSECVSVDTSAVCGNNIAETGEMCDGTDLRGKTCESIFGEGSNGIPVCQDCTTISPGTCTNTGTTTPSECTESDYRCNEKVLQGCIAGKWSDIQTCPDTCSAEQKKCTETTICSGGSYRCDGKILEICAQNEWNIVDNCTSICDADLKKCIQCKADSDCSSGYKCNSSYSCEASTPTSSEYETIFELKSEFTKPDQNSNPAVIENTSTFSTKDKLSNATGINVGPWTTANEPDFESKYIKVTLDSNALSKLANKSKVAVTFYYGNNSKLGNNAQIAVAFYANTTRIGNYCSYTFTSATQSDNHSSPCEVTLTDDKNIHIRIAAFGASSATSGTVRIYPPVVVQAK